MRKGQKIETITKTVGQTPRSGVVVDVRDEDFVEVEWDDGHTSVISETALSPTTSEKSHTRSS